jgi:putative membrane protein
MKKLILAAALLALAAPSHAQNATDQSKAGQGTVSAATKKFVNEAAITDMFEIQAGQLAQQKANDSAYKDFAQMTIADHTKTTEQLKGMNLGIQPPEQLDATHKAKLNKLNALSGAAFERQYKTDQVQGHRQAIGLFERYAKSGENKDVKQFAENTLPTLKTHLQHAEALPRPGAQPTTGSGTRR